MEEATRKCRTQAPTNETMIHSEIRSQRRPEKDTLRISTLRQKLAILATGLVGMLMGVALFSVGLVLNQPGLVDKQTLVNEHTQRCMERAPPSLRYERKDTTRQLLGRLQKDYVDCSKYQYTLPLTEKLRINYVVNEDLNSTSGGSFSAELILQGNGWIGLAHSENGLMVGSTAIIGLPGLGAISKPYQVQKYRLAGQDIRLIEPLHPERQTLTNTSIHQDSNRTIMRFTKLLAEPEEAEIQADWLNTFLFAYGSTNKLGMHENRGIAVLDFKPCKPTNFWVEQDENVEKNEEPIEEDNDNDEEEAEDKGEGGAVDGVETTQEEAPEEEDEAAEEEPAAPGEDDEEEDRFDTSTYVITIGGGPGGGDEDTSNDVIDNETTEKPKYGIEQDSSSPFPSDQISEEVNDSKQFTWHGNEIDGVEKNKKFHKTYTEKSRKIWTVHGIFATLTVGVLLPTIVGSALLDGCLGTKSRNEGGEGEGTWSHTNTQLYRWANILVIISITITFITAVMGAKMGTTKSSAIAVSAAATGQREFPENSYGRHSPTGLALFVIFVFYCLIGALRSFVYITAGGGLDTAPNPVGNDFGSDCEQNEDPIELWLGKMADRWDKTHYLVGICILVVSCWECTTGLDLFEFHFQDSWFGPEFFWAISGTIIAVVGFFCVLEMLYRMLRWCSRRAYW